MSNRQTLDEKLQYFHSLLLEEEINLYQFLKMTTQTTQNDVSKKISREFKKNDLKQVARYLWDQAIDNPPTQTFSDFLKRLYVFAKHAFQDKARQNVQTFSFANPPMSIQQKVMNSNTKDASAEKNNIDKKRWEIRSQTTTANKEQTEQTFLRWNFLNYGTKLRTSRMQTNSRGFRNEHVEV